MRDRAGQILKVTCLALAALLAYQIINVVLHVNPLRRVAIPALPKLDADTNTPSPAVVTSVTVRGGTNAPTTNSPVKVAVKEAGTNVAIVATPTNQNIAPYPATNVAPVVVAMNMAQPPVSPAGTNAPLMIATVATVNTNSARTNPAGTNAPARSTNAPPMNATFVTSARPVPSMMVSGGGRVDLPPEAKARVDRIYESELFGMVMRPQPMALQGIAGSSVFLRAPSGQTGLVKEGDTLGEIKLLKIGINRALVEQDGKKTELTIFNGYGGESLMSNDKETVK